MSKNEKSGRTAEWKRIVERMKNDPTGRAVAITAVVLILAISVLITVTVISNRAKKGTVTDDTTGSSDTQSSVTTNASTDASVTDPSESERPVDAIPSAFLLPVEGTLYTKHDATAQVFSNTMQDYRVHLGIDVRTEADAPVYAAAEGTVERVWEDVRYGQCIAIAHSGGCMTVYKNLSLTLAEGIEKGTKVSAGTRIGTVGDTAMVEIADDPHLHFEMTVDGIAVDPLDYFDDSALASLSVDTAYEG